MRRTIRSIQYATLWLVSVARAQVAPLEPVFSYSIKPPAPAVSDARSTGPWCPQALTTWGFEASGDRLFVLGSHGCSPAAGSFLVAVSPSDSRASVVATFPSAGSVALGAKSAGGVTVHVLETTRISFHEFAPSGKVLSSRTEQSAHAVRYGLLDNSILRLHEDGSIVLASGGNATPTELRSSRNSIILPAGGDLAVVVNQETGEIATHDARTGSIARTRIQSPAIDAGIAYYEAMARKRPQGYTAPGAGLVVLDAKLLADKIYLLLSPYNAAAGALVLQASLDGSVEQQWRLRFESVDPKINPRYLAISATALCIASGAGSIGCFPAGS